MKSEIHMHRSLLTLILSATAAAGAPLELSWQGAGMRLEYRPAGDGSGLVVTSGGQTFRPLAGCGPVFVHGAKTLRPGEYAVRTVAARREGEWVVSTHQARLGASAPAYRLRARLGRGMLTLRFESDAPSARGIAPGRCAGIATIRRLPVGRYGEQQDWPWQCAFWLDEARLWACGGWDLEHGNYSLLGSTVAPAGVSLVEGVTYLPRLDGSVAPLRETLSFRLDRDLWRVVPPLPNLPSPYAGALREMVCLDLWDGRFAVCEELLRWLREATGGRFRFWTIVHNWQTPGYDTRMPEVMPPNVALGGTEAMRSLLRTGRELGFIGLHNNYTVTGPPGGRAERAGMRPLLNAQGKPIPKMEGFVPKAATMLAGARALEPEIHALGTNSLHLDELGAGAIAHAPDWHYYLDFDPKNPEGVMMRNLIAAQQALARAVKRIHQGPLFTETCSSDYLAGYVDGCDWGVINGTRRTLVPDYKLRRLHPLMACYGMGLYYRYFAPVEQWSQGWVTPGASHAQTDDYRAAQLLYGNGAYVFWYPSCPLEFILTEVALVGSLQPYYFFQPVRSVEYRTPDGRWLSLAALVEQGLPYEVRYPVRAEFEGGYTQVVNRTEAPLEVETPRGRLVLPQNGFAAWCQRTGLWAFSAYAPGTAHRVDYVVDPPRGIEFVNPRGGEYRGVTVPTLWGGGKVLCALTPPAGLRGTVWRWPPEFVAGQNPHHDAAGHPEVWSYGVSDGAGKPFRPLKHFVASQGRWQESAQEGIPFLRGDGIAHPGAKGYVVLRWHPPIRATARYRARVTLTSTDPRGGNGIDYFVRIGTETLARGEVGNGGKAAIEVPFQRSFFDPPLPLEVGLGARGHPACDTTAIAVEVVSEE